MRDGMRTRRSLGAYLFVFGLLVGMLFAALVAWANMEASLFDASYLVADAPFRGLSCPPMMTSDETVTVAATFRNPSGTRRLRSIRVHISHGFVTLMREETASFFLEPGESQRLAWTVTPEDAAWGRLVLVRVHELRNLPLPSRTGSCGILVVGLPQATGAQVTAVMVGLSIILMVVGAFLWISGHGKAHRPMEFAQSAILVAGGVVVAAMLFSMMGVWLISGLLSLLVLLLLLTIAAWALSG